MTKKRKALLQNIGIWVWLIAAVIFTILTIAGATRCSQRFSRDTTSSLFLKEYGSVDHRPRIKSIIVLEETDEPLY